MLRRGRPYGSGSRQRSTLWMRRSRLKTTRKERISRGSLISSPGDGLPERRDDVLHGARREGEAADDHDQQREYEAAIDVTLGEHRDRHECRNPEEQRG